MHCLDVLVHRPEFQGLSLSLQSQVLCGIGEQDGALRAIIKNSMCLERSILLMKGNLNNLEEDSSTTVWLVQVQSLRVRGVEGGAI